MWYDDVQAERTDENKYREYCHTALSLFIAASSGWDPLRQDHALQDGVPAHPTDDKTLIAHIELARATFGTGAWAEQGLSGSFAFLQREFENGPFEVRQIAPEHGKFDPSPQPPDERSSSLGGDAALYNNSVASSSSFPQTTQDVFDLSLNYMTDATPVFISSVRNSVEHHTQTSITSAKRRAESPPQGAPLHGKLSVASFQSFDCANGREAWAERDWDTDASSYNAKSLSIAGTPSERAGSMSSVNSLSSFNLAYGSLDINMKERHWAAQTTPNNPADQPTSKDELLSSVHSSWLVSSDMQHTERLIPRRLPIESGLSSLLGYTCDCCPKKPKKFPTAEELQ